MLDLSGKELANFFEEEFPGKTYDVNNYSRGWSFVQAGTKLSGNNLHYEYNNEKVHLDIEGSNWKNIRNYLQSHVVNPKITKWHWGRNNCRWTLEQNIETWEDLKEAFIEIRYILEPYIKKFEAEYIETEQKIKKCSDDVDAHFADISDVLSSNLSIPVYQRPYRWKEKNVIQLLDDIAFAKSNGKMTYLIGTVILHNTDDIKDIVDGQQRITTIVLLLKALDFKEKLPDLKYNHSDSFSNIRLNMSVIRKWIERTIGDRKSFLEYILHSCNFVVINVKKQNEAFQMFETQNGRGKELEAYNLLKAYHIRAILNGRTEDKVDCDRRWEAATMYKLRDGSYLDILYQLFNEHLYRPRLWAKGNNAGSFTKKEIDEFKGITIDAENSSEYAYQNFMVQQELANQFLKNFSAGLFKIKGRFRHGDPDNMNPFMNICQWIINGKNFFDYIETYVEIYKRLFVDLNSSQLAVFKRFYKEYCQYEGYRNRKGDLYIRQVYKSAIIMLFDKFGEVGVEQYYKVGCKVVGSCYAPIFSRFVLSLTQFS